MASGTDMPMLKRATESPFHFHSQRGKLKTTEPQLFDYAAKGNTDILRQLFAQEDYLRTINVDVGDDKDNYTPLIMAAKNGHVDAVQVICTEGHANIDIKAGWNDTTALMKASEKGHAAVVSALMDLEANMNLQNSFKNTALMLACEFGKHEVVAALLREDAHMRLELDVKNEYEYTALILAAEYGHFECVKLLIEAEAGLDLDNKFGKTALIMAAENGKAEIVRLLCDSGADANKCSKRGVSALMLAAVKGHFEVVKILTHYNADITTVNKDMTENALTMACQSGKAEIVKHLIELGADTKYKNGNGDTVLMKACERGSADIMAVLIKHFSEGNFTGKDILTALTNQNKDGNTCLMRACASGNLKVLMYLMALLKKNLHWSSKNAGDQAGTGAEDQNTAKDATTGDDLKAAYRTVANKDGDTAMTLLSKFYRENPKRFPEFIKEATESHSTMYLFDMLPMILQQFDSPNKILNQCKDDLFKRLKTQTGYKADLQLVNALVNIAAALKLAAIKHPLESRDINDLYESVEQALRECMNSPSMDIPSNVMKVLRDSSTEREESIIVKQALAFVSGPLDTCISHDLTGLLGTAQISTHISTVFWATLKPEQVAIIRELPDVFQVRSGCMTFRYRPAFMFFFDGVSKGIYVSLCAYVATQACGHDGVCLMDGPLSWLEFSVIIMNVTSNFYEVGEMWDKSGLWVHICDVWNAIDVGSNILVALWWYFRVNTTRHDLARAFLACSTIPMSIGLLRFFSFYPPLGQLVIMIFGMMQDLVVFLAVFMTSILGFGIAFHSLFSDTEQFQSPGATLLTLFDAALGDHDFDVYADHKYRNIGLVTMCLYTTFVTIILLNLVVARMSSTHDKINDKSFEQWAMVMAKNVKDCLLVKEKRNPFCMLSPPFNVVSMAVFPFDIWARLLSWKLEEVVSVGGFISDGLISILMSPFAAAAEIYLVNRELWSSQIPRLNALFVTMASVALSPIWYTMFLCMIIWSLLDLERIKISKRTHRIVYNADVKSKFPLQRTVMAITFIVFCPLWFLYFVDAVVGQCMKNIHDARATECTKVIERVRVAAEENLRTSKFKSAVKRAAIMSKFSANTIKPISLTVSTGGGSISKNGAEAHTLGLAPPESDLTASVGDGPLNDQHCLVPEGIAATPRLRGSTSESSVDGHGTLSAQPSMRGGFRQAASSIMASSSAARAANEVSINQKTFSFLITEKRRITSPTTGAVTDIFLYDIQDVMMSLFFILTSPIWFVSVFLVKMMVFLGESEPVKNSAWDRLRMHYSVISNVRKVSEAESASKTQHSVTGGTTTTGGLLTMNLIRLNFKGRMGLFGRKANPFVRAIYGKEWKESPTYGIDDSPLANAKIEFYLTDVNELKLEVFDSDIKDAIDVKNGGGPQARKKGVLMGGYIFDIKPWVANGRYEGDLKLLNREGKNVGDTIQVAVKITYPKREKVTSRAPEKDAKKASSLIRSASRMSYERTSLMSDLMAVFSEDEDESTELPEPLFAEDDRERIFKSVVIQHVDHPAPVPVPVSSVVVSHSKSGDLLVSDGGIKRLRNASLDETSRPGIFNHVTVSTLPLTSETLSTLNPLQPHPRSPTSSANSVITASNSQEQGFPVYSSASPALSHNSVKSPSRTPPRSPLAGDRTPVGEMSSGYNSCVGEFDIESEKDSAKRLLLQASKKLDEEYYGGTGRPSLTLDPLSSRQSAGKKRLSIHEALLESNEDSPEGSSTPFLSSIMRQPNRRRDYQVNFHSTSTATPPHVVEGGGGSADVSDSEVGETSTRDSTAMSRKSLS